MNGTVEVAAGHRCVHAEGPIWSDEERKLYWTDIESRALCAWTRGRGLPSAGTCRRRSAPWHSASAADC